MAQSGQVARAYECPLSRVKRTSSLQRKMLAAARYHAIRPDPASEVAT
jgi:hypothetical protein